MRISIIVPVYNTSKFLSTCIESILNQSFTDFEVLLIDDGSTDQSGEICDNYASCDARIKVYHKPNGGVDSARNLGISEARGNYFYFVDSDDKLLPGCLQNLVNGISDGVDLIVGGYIYSSDGVEHESNTSVSHRFFDRTGIMEELLCPKFQSLGMPWTNLYKADIIRDNNLQFNKNIHSIDDRVFMVSYICAMKGKAYHTTKPIYVYNLGVGVTFQLQRRKFDRRTATIFYGQCLIFDMVKKGDFNRKCLWWARFRMMNSFYEKRRYFTINEDFKTCEEMNKSLFLRINKLDWFLFLCRKKVAQIVKK